jgi:DNA-binding transcriptional LysR family regulator
MLERGAERRDVLLQPRLICDDMLTLKQAAIDGLGAVILPTLLCEAELANGSLLQLLPDWSVPLGRIHAAYPTRRGLLPAVRALLEFIASRVAAPAHCAPP